MWQTDSESVTKAPINRDADHVLEGKEKNITEAESIAPPSVVMTRKAGIIFSGQDETASRAAGYTSFIRGGENISKGGCIFEDGGRHRQARRGR
jgi:hypothetical protein